MSIRGGWGDHKNWYGIKLRHIKNLPLYKWQVFSCYAYLTGSYFAKNSATLA